jgi:hypothetical protein
VVVTAVPIPKSVENADAQLSRSDVTRPINPSNGQSLSSTSEGRLTHKEGTPEQCHNQQNTI